VVLNPASGKQSAALVRACLQRVFPLHNIDYEIYETKAKENIGDGVRSRLTNQYQAVIAAGGDGTVSAVINGLAGSGVPLGIFPTGTGNLIARELEIPLEIEKAVELVVKGYRFRKIDAMRIGDRLYALNASLGFTAAAVENTTPEKKVRLGIVAYVVSALSHLFKSRAWRLTVTVDGKAVTHRAIETIVFNGGFLARLLFPAGPDVHIDDGHVDVWILNSSTPADYPKYLYRLLFRKQDRHFSHFLKGEKHISIKSNIPLTVQADGDIIGMAPLEVDILPGVVKVMVPEHPARLLPNLKVPIRLMRLS
jgi:YegS/Rv2252/BmrU family lipid kinase